MMDRSRFKLFGTDTPWVAVFIQRTPYCNLHTGFLYRDARRNLFMLHLGFHHLMLQSDYDCESVCVVPILDLADEMFLAGFLGRIGRSKQNKKIPYSLKIDPQVRFDTVTGDLQMLSGATGLNCSTFVVTVFRSARNPLIDTAGWPPARPEDIQTQQKLVNLLLNHAMPDWRQHGQKLQSQVGTPRIRPEEVAGASLERNLPTTFACCEPNGKWIVEMVDRARLGFSDGGGGI